MCFFQHCIESTSIRICLLCIAQEDPLSSSRRRSMPPLYNEEGHSQLVNERYMPPLYREDGRSLLVTEKEYTSSL